MLGAAFLLLTLTCLAQLLGLQARPAAADDSARQPPVHGGLLREFQIGEQNWLPGHRGVDLAAGAGEQVLASSAGVISWVGVIAGVPMMSIQHPDGLRSTYQPVRATLPQGTAVVVGQSVGILEPGHCPSRGCLHWGLRHGERYLDPLVWLSGASSADVRLLPRAAVVRQLPPPGLSETDDAEPMAPGALPVTGALTSAFGTRINPITGGVEFHDGVDIGAPCGLGVQVLRAGLVTFAGWAGGYGMRVEVTHGLAGGEMVATSYSHLSGIGVATGNAVTAGSSVGVVGTTGFSTGCHLHYSVTLDGRAVDPLAGVP